jgi:hypothetical protein
VEQYLGWGIVVLLFLLLLMLVLTTGSGGDVLGELLATSDDEKDGDKEAHTVEGSLQQADNEGQ